MLQTLAKHAFAGAFDDNAVRVMVEALDQAWKAVQENGASVAAKGHAEAARELLALRIIEIAQLGEPIRPVSETTHWPISRGQISRARGAVDRGSFSAQRRWMDAGWCREPTS